MKTEMVARFKVRARIGAIEERMWPILPEQTAMAKGNGYFVTLDAENKPHVFIRTLPIEIVCDDFNQAEEFLAIVEKEYGNVFAGVTIVRNYITDLHAI